MVRYALVAVAAVSGMAMLYVGLFQIGWVARLACPGFGSGCGSVALAPFSRPYGIADGLLGAAVCGVLCALAIVRRPEAAAALIGVSAVWVILNVLSLAEMQKHGALVRTIAGGERIVDVADGHHPGGERDLRFLQRPRIALAGEFLVVAVGDVRHALQRPRPGDLGEEPVGVRHVRLDLPPLVLRQRAFADGELDDFVLGEERAMLSRERPL